jgi:hypothetical protein
MLCDGGGGGGDEAVNRPGRGLRQASSTRLEYKPDRALIRAEGVISSPRCLRPFTFSQEPSSPATSGS